MLLFLSRGRGARQNIILKIGDILVAFIHAKKFQCVCMRFLRQAGKKQKARPDPQKA
jgi:hypothetical protein